MNLVQVISQLIRAGESYINQKPQALRLRMVNALALLGTVASIFPALVYVLFGIYPISLVIVFLLSSVAFASTIVLHSKGQLQVAGILATATPLLMIVFAKLLYPNVSFELLFFATSISPLLTIYKNQRLVTASFTLYIALFLFFSLSDFSTTQAKMSSEDSIMNLSIYITTAVEFVLFCSLAYHINQLSLRELNEREERLLETQKELEKVSELKTTFIANMSHEIRTPMNGIIGFSNLLLQEKLSPQQREYASIIHTGSEQLLNIVNDILDFSKIEMGEVQSTEETVDVVKLMKDLHDLFFQMANQKKLNLINTNTGNYTSLLIKTDGQKLRQIISNLLNNAIKFTEKGSVQFGFEISEHEDTIGFFVKDTGVGISEKDQKAIFGRFKQVGQNNAIKGTGLGLAISKTYTELLGGTLSLHSSLGEGTTFRLRIPFILVHSTLHSTPPLQELPKIPACSILLAEDVRFNALLMKKILAPFPVNLHFVKDGQEAVDFVKKNTKLDLVLMDVKMPIMDGEEALKIIKSQYPDLPIVALTALSTPQEKKRLLNKGFDGFVSKPIHRIELLKTIGKCIST